MTRKGISDPVKAWGMCLITSEPYAEKHGLNLIRITGMTYPGREHWAAIEWDEESRDGVVVDLTARQFDPNAPAAKVHQLLMSGRVGQVVAEDLS